MPTAGWSPAPPAETGCTVAADAGGNGCGGEACIAAVEGNGGDASSPSSSQSESPTPCRMESTSAAPSSTGVGSATGETAPKPPPPAAAAAGDAEATCPPGPRSPVLLPLGVAKVAATTEAAAAAAAEAWLRADAGVSLLALPGRLPATPATPPPLDAARPKGPGPREIGTAWISGSFLQSAPSTAIQIPPGDAGVAPSSVSRLIIQPFTQFHPFSFSVAPPKVHEPLVLK
mmetsp:Transcript_10919/g.29185  ORF Transcript_10919/g.29185 Transcript_10919/m.29185 type:complete len:231 (+) Transcript_10919:422-1114(+)